MAMLGTPSQEYLEWLQQQRSDARRFLDRLPHQPEPEPFVYPAASREACHALTRMLVLHPERRATAADTMQMDFFRALHRPKDLQETAREAVDWTLDGAEPTRRLLQSHLSAECAHFPLEFPWRERDALASCEQLPEARMPEVGTTGAKSSGALQPFALAPRDVSWDLSTQAPSPELHRELPSDEEDDD